MRRHPVIGQAVPGREFQHGDVGREECERARERRHARPVAAHDQEARRRRVGARGDRAREIGDDQPLGAVGDAGERQRAARDQRSGGRFRHHRRSAAVDVKVAQLAEQRGVEIGRHVAVPPSPRPSRSRSGTSISRSNSSSFVLGQFRDRCVGEAAHDQVDLAHAAMPGAEQKLAPAHIQSLARSCTAGHRSLATPKTRTCRAGLYSGENAPCQARKCSLPAISGV